MNPSDNTNDTNESTSTNDAPEADERAVPVEDERKRRVITLTGRAPIRIIEDDWPVIARSHDYEGEHSFQSFRHWWLTVRRHDDGRMIVYGVHDTSFATEYCLADGEMLDAVDSDDVAAAIQRVGQAIGASDAAIASCVADLPAEDVR